MKCPLRNTKAVNSATDENVLTDSCSACLNRRDSSLHLEPTG